MKRLLLLIAIFLTACSGDKLVLQCFEEPKDKAFYTLLTFDLNTNSSWIEEFGLRTRSIVQVILFGEVTLG